MILLAARFGKLADEHGPRLYLTLGPFLVGVGILLILPVRERSDFWTFGIASVHRLLARPRDAGRADHVDRAEVGAVQVRRASHQE